MRSFRNKLGILVLLFAIGASSLHAQEGTVTIDQDRDIAKLLEYKKDLSTVEFYKIQIFSNSNRSEAEKARSNFRNSYGQYSTDLVYDTPNYKVHIGKFRTKLEADRALKDIKRKYTYAFIFKPKLKPGK
jgi:hypothetical protein